MALVFGALQPKIDLRDYELAAGVCEFPESYICKDLPPVKNQRTVSSCVAHATAAILEAFNKTETGTFVPLSTNFIYGMQGVKLNRLDKGMYLRDACKIAQQYGDATERSISGNTEQPNCTEELQEKLTDDILNESKQYRIKSYAKCKTEEDIKYALMNYGPVLGSIKWYKKYTIKNKVITFDETASFGYHAIMICGWNKNGWICQNSWGRNWNGNGRFIYPNEKPFSEVWSFVDATNENVYIPKNNHWIDYIYKIINFIVNLIKKSL